MSYTVLARKWRPQTFAELAGQEHVQRALINALDNDRLHHGFLFTGTRGVGKTTIARIFAKCINCEKGVSSTPCGECSACVEIDEGRFVDLLEVDAASRTKVDDTRELLDNVQYAPTVGRYKVYLIDEVHMLSRHSFNALLKTLEEPPPHVKFLLATTDPQKLPATVLSRCLQFNLKRLSKDIIVERLQEICTAEEFAFENNALILLAHGADGSMRDALSLLDQAVAYGGGKIEEADVRAMLGTVERNKVYELARTLIGKDAKRVLELVATMDEYAPDYSEVLQELSLLLQRAAIFSMTQVAPRDSAEMLAVVKAICEGLNAEEIQLAYQIAIIGRRDLPLAPDPRSGFEMVLLRMLAFLPDAQGAPSPAGSSSTESSTAGTSQADSSKTSAAKASSSKGAAQQTQSRDNGSSVETRSSDESALARSLLDNKTEKKDRTKASSARQGANSTNVVTLPSDTAKGSHLLSPAETSAKKKRKQTDDRLADGSPRRSTSAAGIGASGVDFSNWATVIDLMGLQGAARQLAANCVVDQSSETALKLVLDGSNQHMLTQQVQAKLTAVIQNHLGDDFSVNVTLGKVTVPTPALLQEQANAAEWKTVRESLLNDPNVKALLDTFDATIHEDSIKPIN